MTHLDKSHKQHFIIKEEDIVDTVLDTKLGTVSYLANMFKSLFISDKKIGELNGKWAGMFKIVLTISMLLIPTLFGWGVWITNKVIGSEYHIVQTQEYDVRITRLEEVSQRDTIFIDKIEKQLNKIDDHLSILDPTDICRRINNLENVNEEQNIAINTLDKNNTAEHTKVLLLLESIKTKLDLQSNGKVP